MFDPFTGLMREAELDEGEAFAFDHRHESARPSALALIALRLRQDLKRQQAAFPANAVLPTRTIAKPAWRWRPNTKSGALT